jgi:predicted amidophosphoribosyltransferase
MSKCPVCQAEFDTRRTKEWSHCELCGRHGQHECEGKVDRVARRERAREFVLSGRGKYKTWADKPYEEL